MQVFVEVRHSYLQDSLQAVVSHLIWMLGIKLRSSETSSSLLTTEPFLQLHQRQVILEKSMYYKEQLKQLQLWKLLKQHPYHICRNTTERGFSLQIDTIIMLSLLGTTVIPLIVSRLECSKQTPHRAFKLPPRQSLQSRKYRIQIKMRNTTRIQFFIKTRCFTSFYLMS